MATHKPLIGMTPIHPVNQLHAPDADGVHNQTVGSQDGYIVPGWWAVGPALWF